MAVLERRVLHVTSKHALHATRPRDRRMACSLPAGRRTAIVVVACTAASLTASGESAGGQRKRADLGIEAIPYSQVWYLGNTEESEVDDVLTTPGVGAWAAYLARAPLAIGGEMTYLKPDADGGLPGPKHVGRVRATVAVLGEMGDSGLDVGVQGAFGVATLWFPDDYRATRPSFAASVVLRYRWSEDWAVRVRGEGGVDPGPSAGIHSMTVFMVAVGVARRY